MCTIVVKLGLRSLFEVYKISSVEFSYSIVTASYRDHVCVT